jgi:ArsR family transcriptional regulator
MNDNSSNPTPGAAMPEALSRLDVQCAEKLKVLADPTRLSVMEILLDGPRQVGEINARLGLDQSLLSHHLKVLRDAGLVQTTRCGKGVRYELAPEVAMTAHSLDLGCCALTFRS